ncbi:MAG: hypothetical protein CVU09_14165 [Bacteroidetes bacterium HGW-Bacteroidetes-4]|jgi:HAMP domain-containing protein|nr:MAG: hypothetical protein CVU09_14165 [Bacteroidetes bacterium HGW-Bacteroidetes-4]
MKDVLIFATIVVFAFIPFGGTIIYLRYRKTIVFPLAMLVLITSMGTAIMAYAINEFGFKSLYWAVPLAFIFILTTNIFIKKWIQKPIKDLMYNMDKAAIGDLDIRIDEKTLEPVHEVGAIARSFKLLLNSLHKIAQFSDEITKNNFDHEYELLSDKDSMGYSLQNMRNSLLKARQEEQIRKLKEEQESWIAQGIAKFSDILRNYSQNVNQLSRKFIMELVNYLDIVQGGLFLLTQEDDETFLELKAAVAFDREKMLSKKFRIGEGLVGRCAYEKLPIYLTEIPENYVTISSGLGTGNPRSIALIPALMENKVLGVIELVSFNKFEPFQLEFIAKVGENLASSISMVRINEKTQKLLEESQVQKDELSAQEEEMRQNLEELQATQEEMKRKEMELTQINEDLLAKINQLEKKNDN